MRELSKKFNFGEVTEEKIAHILNMLDTDQNQTLSLEEITPLIIIYMREHRKNIK